MRRLIRITGLLLILTCGWNVSVAQQLSAYTSWLTGDTADVVTQPMGGVVLAGGSTDVDAAMRWFLRQSAGGDVVIIRATGRDGYNDYLFNRLGERVNSVETLLINTRELASHPDILRKVRQAEAIFFAGGDQANYVSSYAGTPLNDVLNERIRAGIVLGGTSAGCAVLGYYYFAARQGSVQSAEALANPFDNRVSLGYNNFLKHPLLTNILTDQHYSNRNRHGRHVAFLARAAQERGGQPRGLGIDEKTAVCVQPNGTVQVFGSGNAYFLLASGSAPEVCREGQPLNWNAGGKAIRVDVMAGSAAGTTGFSLARFRPAANVATQYWYVEKGQLIKP